LRRINAIVASCWIYFTIILVNPVLQSVMFWFFSNIHFEVKIVNAGSMNVS